jgi:archaellum component FlaC
MRSGSDGDSKSRSFLNKSLIVTCIVSACTAFAFSFIVLKISISNDNKRFELISSDISSLEAKIKVLDGLISAMKEEISPLKNDLKSSKERLSTLYSHVASLQKDVSTVRDVLNLKAVDIDDSVKDLHPEKRSFIESLEGLVKNGSPFDGLMTSYAGKIDIEDYVCGKRLAECSKGSVKSVDTIKKDFVTVGRLVFSIELAESFWERQKRTIIEKLSSIVKIRSGDDNKDVSEAADDKSLFGKAYNELSKGNLSLCLDYLEKIRAEDERVGNLISDVRSRLELDSAFSEFKNEFVSARSEAHTIR